MHAFQADMVAFRPDVFLPYRVGERDDKSVISDGGADLYRRFFVAVFYDIGKEVAENTPEHGAVAKDGRRQDVRS